MCPKLIVISCVGGKDSAQVGFVEDEDVIEAYPADRATQPLRMTVCQGNLGAIG
jgi:hypothetical protein